MKQAQLVAKSKTDPAQILPASFYTDPHIFEKLKASVFTHSWHCIGLSSNVQGQNRAEVFTLMEGFMDEPLMLTRDDHENLHCLSNVCTHRAHLLVTEGGSCQELICRYHRRKWTLDGKFTEAPGFENQPGFPSSKDNLPALPLHTLGDLLFTSLAPRYEFKDWIAPVQNRLKGLDLSAFHYAPELSQMHLIQAHWILYCDNYLDSFRLPFIHPALNQQTGKMDLKFELFPYGSLQVVKANDGQNSFNWPEDHPDYGKEIAAYHFWLFPNIMLNFYPWGLSLNIVEPLSLSETRIRFERFIWKEELYNDDEHDLLQLTELESQRIVEAVQKGLKSQLYQGGRFAPEMEVAIAHFHGLLRDFTEKK